VCGNEGSKRHDQVRNSTINRPAPLSEAALYGPVKRFFESRGFVVKGEVNGCDLVARRGDEPPVIVELKLRFTLGLVLQGIDRLAISERVYLAVPRPPRSARGLSPEAPRVRRLCRRIELEAIGGRPAQRRCGHRGTGALSAAPRCGAGRAADRRVRAALRRRQYRRPQSHPDRHRLSRGRAALCRRAGRRAIATEGVARRDRRRGCRPDPAA
jgi:hypothetical protein